MHTDVASSFAVAGPDPACRAWLYYYDDEQQALLGQIRAAWGQDCVIQICGGRLRIFAEEGRLEFFSARELFDAIAVKTQKGIGRRQK
ncbi:hypothetical protein [Paraburkholderia tuberum]|uniref:Uncharacterized protein n=1 Tax=Paraburkholderia tuberum TaxID=157910 RepID=A0A1H1JZZ9_9BURK|nr:hypothetical protein [Paraburkholderia tuberum]SDR55556.1 hypothetical protein SAMN05445850_6103 [Paraburkholderia tuberum]